MLETKTSSPAQYKKYEQREKVPGISMFILARWQLSTTWKLLLVAEIGILAAAILLSAIPLYSSVALDAGLRDSLNASPDNAYVTETAASSWYNPQKTLQLQEAVSQKVQTNLANYVQPTPIFSLALSPSVLAQNAFGKTEMDVTGFPGQQIPRHAHLLQGSLPSLLDQTIEFVTTPAGLAALKAIQPGYQIGSVFQDTIGQATGFFQGSPLTLNLKDVGIIAPPARSDTFWHATDFQPISTTPGEEIIPVLVANEALSTSLLRMEAPYNSSAYTLKNPVTLNWYYSLNLATFDIGHLHELTAQMNRLLTELNPANDSLVDPPFIIQDNALGPVAIFQYYSDRITLLNVPVGVLFLLIGGLILFFVSIIAGLLLEQQGTQIAFLRSKGAARGQLIAALAVQSALMALPILVLGPLLAWGLAIRISQVTLQGNDRNAVKTLLTQPVATLLSVFWISLLVVIVALLVMTFALFQKLRTNTLTHLQETGRNRQPALWQRWRLDLVGSAVALVGAGFTLYLTNAGVLNAQTRALILPVMLLGAILAIVIAGVLLLFRLFPLLLRWAARLALARRGVTAVLAIAQMARSPWQVARMSLLFAFTLAFTIFTLTFNASQAQRTSDSVRFQVGSDFSGILSGPASAADWQQTEQAYAQIPGVQSATIGHIGIMVSANASLEIQAVDAATATQTLAWSAPDSTQQVSSLLQQMLRQRQSAVNASLVPVIIDAGAAQALTLATGSTFSLRDDNGSVNFLVIGTVRNIPSIIDDSSGSGTGTSDTSIAGGILADYQTFAATEFAQNGQEDEAESMWLKTSDNPATIASVRRELNSGQAQLNSLSDRQAITASLANDPLEATVQNAIFIGTLVALTLGLLGSLLGSWINARRRVLNVAMMRALGNTPAQIVKIILWEQVVIYLLALILGIGGGLLLAGFVAPSLLYSPIINPGITQSIAGSAALNLTGSGQIYLLQEVPAGRVIVPIVPIVLVIGSVVIVSAFTLGLIVRLVTRPALSTILRFNEH